MSQNPGEIKSEFGVECELVGIYTVSSVSNEFTNLSKVRKTTSGTRIEIQQMAFKITTINKTNNMHKSLKIF
jgi:hypothetical protein